jgi:hypothetical protein
VTPDLTTEARISTSECSRCHGDSGLGDYECHVCHGKSVLTTEEARIVFTVLHSSWIPVQASQQFSSAVKKLGIIGGGFCCRDCVNLGKHAHHLGGLVCDDHRPPPQHKPQESK